MNHRKRKNSLLLLTIIIIFSLHLPSCVSITRQEFDTSAISSLPQYWLTTSMYAGPFYKNNEMTLMDHRPSSAILEAFNADGDIIFPPKSSHIIKAGTLVQITKISYPNTKEALKRPAFSPKDRIWIHLKVAKERGKVTIFSESEHIIIVPKHIVEKSHLKDFVNSFLAKKDPHEWILGRESYIREGIWQKKPQIGMNTQDLIATLGMPQKKIVQPVQGEHEYKELWQYAHYFIVIKNDLVIKTQHLSS